MSHLLSEHDIDVIRRCTRVVLDSGALYPEEIATRVGVDAHTLQRIAEALSHLPRLLIEKSAFEEISFADFVTAVHNSLVEVAYGIKIDDAALQSKYGLSRREVQAMLSKWTLIDNA